jgi:hypothetical protein
MKLLKLLASIAFTLTVAACGGGGGNASAPPVTDPSTLVAGNSKVGAIKLNVIGPSVLNADGTSSVTIKVFALTSGNASVAGATIDLTATNGVILSAPSVVTAADGATLTVIADSANQSNRTSTISASCLNCTAAIVTSDVKVVGATVALSNAGASALIVGGSSATLTVTVKGVGGVGLQGVDVAFASTDASLLRLSAATAKTNSSGVASVLVSGIAAGSASVNVSALGDVKSQAYTSGAATAVLAITSPSDNSIVEADKPLVISVAAPGGASTVTFASTRGTFAGGASSLEVQVVGGTASATLTASSAGTAAITVVDNLKRSVSITLVISLNPTKVNKILLDAVQTTVPVVSTSGAQSSVAVRARAVYFDGVTDQFVAGTPIEFSMLGGPGAGEFLTPALAYTNSSGVAVATFNAGTAASIPDGIVINAKVQNSFPVVVQTGSGQSSKSLKLTIGGQSLSVAFGPSSKIGSSTDNTLYLYQYSVIVTDANNNPVANQPVTLRMRPVAFSLGTSCSIGRTFCSEDVNGNDSLDPGEDGARTELTASLGTNGGDISASVASCPKVPPIPQAPGSSNDTNLTPSNSDGGAVPSSVTTDVNGIASFTLTYLKASSLWVVNKLTATVSSNGTETSKSTIFRLVASEADVKLPDTCFIPNSPYGF